MPDAVERPYLVISAAMGSLALLAVNSSAGMLDSPLLRAAEFGAPPVVEPVVLTVLALVAWQLAPACWPVLLLAGAACAVPESLAVVAPDLAGGGENVRWVLAAGLSGPPLTVVGLLGAATLVWRTGWRAVGVALAGAAVATQLVAPLAFTSLTVDDALTEFLPTLTLVLVGVAAVTALGGFAAGRWPVGRPSVRVTAAGAVASLAPLPLLFLWPKPRTSVNLGDLDDTLLVFGLAALAGGLVVGAIAGGTALVGGLVAGSLVGALGAVMAPVPVIQSELPALATAVTVAAVPLGFLAALSRRRLRFGVGGLLVVIAGLVTGYVMSEMDSPYRTEMLYVVEPVVVLAAGVGVVAGIAAIAERLADGAAAPAVLVGLAAPFALGLTALLVRLVVRTRPAAGAPDLQLPLLGVIVALCVATIALLAVTGVLRRARSVEPEPEPARADELA